MDHPMLTLVDRREQSLIDSPPDAGRAKTASHQNNAVLDNKMQDGAAAVMLPKQVFERTRWQRRYAASLQMTDCIVVCIAVVLAQYLRFGPALSTHGYLKYHVPAFSVLFVIVWLAALAKFHSRSP